MLANMKYVRRERHISTPIATSSTKAYLHAPYTLYNTCTQRCLLDSKADHDAEIDFFGLRSNASKFYTLPNFALTLVMMMLILTLVAAILYSVNSHKITQAFVGLAFCMGFAGRGLLFLRHAPGDVAQ